MIQHYSPDLYVEPDLTSIEHYLPSYAARITERKLALDEVKLGLLKINEYRNEQWGRDPVPWGDEYLVPATVGPASEIAGFTAPIKETEEEIEEQEEEEVEGGE
jgi:hypothetical protein